MFNHLCRLVGTTVNLVLNSFIFTGDHLIGNVINVDFDINLSKMSSM